MKILAIDTSSQSGSIALLEDRRLISEWTVGDAGTHSNWLLKSLEAHLKNAGQKLDEIDLFAIDVGPGSFTGLRIGISALKGLAWPLGKDIAGVSTLASLAMNLPYSARVVCPVLDARKGEVYTALYETMSGLPKAVMPDSAMRPEALLKEIEGRGLEGEIVFLGSGLSVYMELLVETLRDAYAAPPHLWHIRASNVGLLAFEHAGEAVSPAELVPVYLRKSEAELKSKL
ncbi:MAG: tRNA (adenosine(37)-N6)-threonylcarbamoyltransferase complex dimerization subunit type 1 TsaB [Deltaproteobacteria bacterium]|nr:tRNA (adenosine(37)-N6)-threonylcarbamoyltransferase complex dimerization subunit type 1 TsaB [Deltaproteobacteria bacterium]MBZ0218976.1 tRNA (adenosine(37)-N6)-threonylcarbamoyltransferase complex dimerization subunit type 1 TsaB [Deltaproteobacteria bacterium]